MAQAANAISGTTWTAITSAGESGSCWLKECVDSGSGQKDIRIVHTDGAAPTGDAPLAYAKRVYESKGNDDMMTLSADNASDIYYARGLTSEDGGTIIVDVV